MRKIPISEEAFTLIELAREECTRDDKDMQIAFLATLCANAMEKVSPGYLRAYLKPTGPSEKEIRRAEAARETRTAAEIAREGGE